ncbi:tripartite tricarboxylate transporter substrate binding protein [Cupriavidus sp. CV2]|uniref:Bug family tripartite tricarboxylate transporter substrate binding protein n=1 Tax=Cupriavidus ulmosensis TaxID=3065913 RepID=UPI00296B4B2D|nr:tripartite tricarboxylate transporter substrate binding protein [Cupriavidus sp. CV2]MDW3680538.1 tripartite tricarboxylate transporter substrate binding protein [Cupriavidus sp. CV2]
MNAKLLARRCIALVAVFASCAALANPYPSKPITLVLPTAPGGAVDNLARVFAQLLSAQVGQPVIIDNRSGAGGNLSSDFVSKAPSDGYTILLTLGSTLTINPALYKKLPFDPVNGFEPISVVATSPYVLAAGPSLPVKSIGELIALAKKQPGSIHYASAGNGTPNHLFTVMVEAAAGIELVHIPYKSVAGGYSDVAGGRVQLMFASLPSLTPFIKSGQLRALGVSSAKRSPLAPGLPTIAETLPGYEAVAWYGLLAPAGTPKEVISKLHEATVKVLGNKELREKWAEQGIEPWGSTPVRMHTLMHADLEKWAKIVRATGARID